MNLYMGGVIARHHDGRAFHQLLLITIVLFLVQSSVAFLYVTV